MTNDNAAATIGWGSEHQRIYLRMAEALRRRAAPAPR